MLLHACTDHAAKHILYIHMYYTGYYTKVNYPTCRCDQKCDLKLFMSKPGWIRPAFRSDSPIRYGFLQDLNADQIAYAAQASEAGFIVSTDRSGDEVKLNILKENYEHSDDKMYVSFINDASTKEILSRIISRPVLLKEDDLKNLNIEFEVKHSYFNTLIRAVNKVQPEIIERILPSREAFLPLSNVDEAYIRWLLPPHMPGFNIDNQDQLKALHTILSCDPR